MELSRPLNCLIIVHVIDDPDTIEHYLTIDPITTEKCMPIALRDVLNEYAIPAGLGSMTTPNASTLVKYLQVLWCTYKEPNQKLVVAIDENLTYLVPYLLTHGATTSALSADAIARVFDRGDSDMIRLLFLPSEINGQAMWQPAQINLQLFPV